MVSDHQLKLLTAGLVTQVTGLVKHKLIEGFDPGSE
jgi:hypothetical protein